MFKFIAKRFLPLIAANLDLDIDTVQKSDGAYLRIRVEAFGFVLLDRIVKVSDQPAMDNPLDIFESSKLRSLPPGAKSVLNAKTLNDLK